MIEMTLLIKNVRILGADRTFPEPMDVFVSDDKISAIGSFPNKAADDVVDGQGAYLSPGFIDVNTDSDHYLTLFEHPGQEDFLRQGVTTIFGGMCGSSLAPLFYGSLESIRKWSGGTAMNIDWHTMGEFLAALDKRPLAVNFGTMVGHSTIRRAIVGEALRDLTKNELDVFKATLRAALDEGGFGLSTGLAYVHSRKTPYSEIKALATVVQEKGGMYATHLRDVGEHIGDSIEETVRLAKETGVRALVSHFVPLRTARAAYERALARVNELPKEFNFHFDLYPFDSMLLPLYTFLPLWAQNGGLEAMLANLKDEWLGPKIKNDMPPLDDGSFMVAHAPGNEFFVGKTLEDIKTMYDLRDGREALLRFMAAVGLRGTIVYRNLDTDLILKAMTSPRSFVASNAPSFGEISSGSQIKSERSVATFTKFLSLVENENLLPLEIAIKKITLEPAQTFGLANRGLIKEGNIADLTCFKNGSIHFTIVGGKVVVKDGEFQDKFPGKVLRRGART